MKAKRIVKHLLEADLDFDPERYVNSTLFPKESEIFDLLRQLKFTPVEKRRVRTMWEKVYPWGDSAFRLDLELEWQEGENRDRIPFWMSIIEGGESHILTKYILQPHTISFVLRKLDAWFSTVTPAVSPMTAINQVERTMNYVRNNYN